MKLLLPEFSRTGICSSSRRSLRLDRRSAGLIHEAFLSRDIYSCWWSIFRNNSLENRVQFLAKRNAFVLDHQNCRRDVTCKAGPSCSKAGYRYRTHLSLSHTHTPTQIFFFKCPLRCSLAQANLFAIFMVASVSVIDLWQCISRQLFRRSCFMVLLRYSSWVVWGQKMCALKSPMSHVSSIIPLQVFFGTKTWGLCPPAPPPMASMEKNTMHSTNVLFTKRNIR